MFLTDWLGNLKSKSARAVNRSTDRTRRRRREPLSRSQNAESLEIRVMLSAHAFATISSVEHGHTLPSITGIGAPLTYVVGGSPVILAPTAQVTDAASAFANSRLSVQIPSATASSHDQLSITSGNGVTVSAGTVSFNAIAIGTFTGGSGGTALTISFNSSATKVSVQSILAQISYSNSNLSMGAGSVGVVFTFTDGNDISSQPAFDVIQIVPASEITNLGPTVQYVAGGDPVLVTPTAQVSDSTNSFANSTLSVRFVFNRTATSTDVLSIIAGNGVALNGASVVYNGTTIGTAAGGTAGAALVIAFNSSATQAGVQAVIDGIAYSNSSSAPSLGHRLVEFQFTDGNGSVSLPAVQVVQVLSSPAITGIGAPVTYTLGGSPVAIASTAQVVDNNNAYANSSLTVQFATAQIATSTNILSLTNGNGVTVTSGQITYNGIVIGTVTGGTGAAALDIKFNASATQAGIQAVVDQIAYSNSSSTARVGDRVITLQFTDGAGSASQLMRQEVHVVSPAAITHVGPPVTYTAGGSAVLIAPSAQVTDSNSAFAGSTLTVQMTTGQSAKSTDVLSIAAGNGVTVSSGTVSYNGTAIGTVTGGTAGAPLVVTFNSSATQAGVNAVLDQIGYSNTNATLGHGERGISLEFTDGNGAVSQLVFQEIRLK